MDYITPEHPFFSVDNIATLLRLVETRVLEASGETIRFEANEEFVQQMHTAAQQYPQYLITATYQEGVDPPAAAAAAMEVDDDDSAEETEEDSEADEESGDEIEIEDDGDEVFDIDRFASKGKFRQDEAEQAFHEWKRGRDKQKRPLHFYDDMGPGGPPEIPEDVFRRRQIELTQRLVDRDTCKLAEVDAELQDPTLTPRERKKLDQMRASLTRAIADRQAQMA